MTISIIYTARSCELNFPLFFTPPSIQYRVLASGATDWELFFPVSWFRRQPTDTSFCACHYTGKTIRGKVFETSEKNGRHVPLEVQVIFENFMTKKDYF